MYDTAIEIADNTYQVSYKGHTLHVRFIGRLDEEEHGESFNNYYTLAFVGVTKILDERTFKHFVGQIHGVGGLPVYDDDWMSEMIWNIFPAIRCQHDYDCCGNWYPNSGTFVGWDFNKIIVRQSFHLNV